MSIALIGPSFLDAFFDPAREALTKKGHRVHRIAERDELLHDADLLTSLSVLAALPAFRADHDLMERAPRLRAIVSPFTGIEGYDVVAATKRGILIANGQISENSISMAEAVVMLTLNSLYELRAKEKLLRENLPPAPASNGRMLQGKTVGLIGFGQIAQAVATRLSTWDVRLLVNVRTPRALPSYASAVPLEQLLAESDVVVVAVTLHEGTKGLLNDERLRLMKPNVVFVNVARGGIVEDDAIAGLARERPTMRVGLDVFDPEPLRTDSPLRDLPNVILTPHVVGRTVESQRRLPVAFLENILAVADGRVPPYVANRDVLSNWPRAR
jgi:phosphoglycerate dehydrogenase-like enzyme